MKISHVGYIAKDFFINTDNRSVFKFSLDDGIILNDEIKVTSTRVKKNSPYPYTNISKIKEEVDNAKNTFKKYKWPTIDVTRKSVEETAASILNIYEINKKR